MRKSGLHKQISSIFDGVPVPQNEQPQPSDTGEPSVQETGPAPAAEGPPTEQPSLAKRLSADPADCPQSPAIPMMRPAPLPKKKYTPTKSKPDITKQLRKTVFGGAGTISPHQKKMTALVGILSIVFGVVMFVSLGGVGQSQAVAADQDDDNVASTQTAAPKVTPESWTLPEPVSATVRDVTRPAPKVNNAVGNPEDSTTVSAATDLVVRGIVFSKTRPTAIINNKVYCVGELVSGAKVVSITRDDVTFESNGKSWTQQVQR